MVKKSKKARFLRGAAILTVLVSLALMVAIVVELSSSQMVSYKLAINQRDALKAEALAQSAANFSKIVLLLQEPLQDYMLKFAEMKITMPSFAVWELIPVSSDVLKAISGLEDEDSSKPIARKVGDGHNVYQPKKGGFGNFSGMFNAVIKDEESKISIRKWSKLEKLKERKSIFDRILKILSLEKYKDILKSNYDSGIGFSLKQVVANIYDYTSPSDNAIDPDALPQNFGRAYLGPKMANYTSMPSDIKPKKAPFDSMAELRLVPGVNDAVFSVLSQHVSIYSETEKINILSADEDMLGLIFYSCAKNKDTGTFAQPGLEKQLMERWNQQKSKGEVSNTLAGVMEFLQKNNIEVDKKSCQQTVGNHSKTFTVNATGTAGNITKTIVMRLRSAGGTLTMYQYQYL